MRKQAYKALFVREAALKLRKLRFNILLNEQRPTPTLHFLPHIDSPSTLQEMPLAEPRKDTAYRRV